MCSMQVMSSFLFSSIYRMFMLKIAQENLAIMELDRRGVHGG